ncbi:MAG TPA: YHS domain-containing protein [Caldilineaceae bacterium]|nr:YHS domain-containing protein [Caldilineaceae bacterium]
MAQVRDVVCGMMVDTETAQHKSEYQGQTYYFCAAGCKRAFDQNPEKYLGTESAGHGGQHH